MNLFKSLMRKIDFWQRGINVWPGAYVYPTAEIGAMVSIGRNAEIGNNVHIGPCCRIGHGAFIPEGVYIEEQVFIGPGVICTNDNFPPSSRRDWQHTIIKKKAAIGAGCVIKPGITIGERAIIGCGSVVTKDVPADEVYAGNPAEKLSHASATLARYTSSLNGGTAWKPIAKIQQLQKM